MASSYIEIAKHYNKKDFENWRSAEWWENDKWRNFIPKEEQYRVDKYRNQACKKYNKGNMEGHQFIEILEMMDLKKVGYKWLHANYYLFKDVKPTAKVYWPGTEEVIGIIGRNKIDRLHNAVLSMSLNTNHTENPKEPDIFAYRINKNSSNAYDMIFIETKNKDNLRPGQLLGFNLINKYLKIPIIVVRYFER